MVVLYLSVLLYIWLQTIEIDVEPHSVKWIKGENNLAPAKSPCQATKAICIG